MFDKSWCPEAADLFCVAVAEGIRIEVANPGDFDAFVIRRDGVEIAKLNAQQMPYIDAIPPEGIHVYTVVASKAFVPCPALERTCTWGGDVPMFRRGDADANGGLPNITDGIYVLNYLFLSGSAPPCREAADADNTGSINITDGIYILNYLFQGGPIPPSPGPEGYGPDTDDPGSAGDLGCETYDPAGC